MIIITTKDGSHSLFNEEYEEIYHSQNGAIQESKHVFIHSGLEYAVNTFGKAEQQPLRIFEVGFGTGLNALLSFIAAEQQGLHVAYETIERFPVTLPVAQQLNYPDLLEAGKYRTAYETLHSISWNEWHTVSRTFFIKKYEADCLSFEPAASNFHVVYFDAFGPENQPDMWTLEMMQKMYRCLVPGGILVSYCSKSAFRKTLIAAGFDVQKLPGPPGKREMVRAAKK